MWIYLARQLAAINKITSKIALPMRLNYRACNQTHKTTKRCFSTESIEEKTSRQAELKNIATICAVNNKFTQLG